MGNLTASVGTILTLLDSPISIVTLRSRIQESFRFRGWNTNVAIDSCVRFELDLEHRLAGPPMVAVPLETGGARNQASIPYLKSDSTTL